MAASRFEIDTADLSGVISSCSTSSASVKKKNQEMFSDISALKSIWEGPGSVAFMVQYAKDRATMDKLIAAFDGYIEALGKAKCAYDAAESDVGSAVAGVQV